MFQVSIISEFASGQSQPKQNQQTQTVVKENKAKKEQMVLICNSKSAYAYHSHYCSGLSRCKSSVSKVKKSEAEAMGYVPCKKCY